METQNSIRSEILAAILKHTHNAYYISAADAGRFIDNRCCHSVYRQIEQGRFQLRVVRLGRNWAVRVHDLVDFLVTGQVEQAQPIENKPQRTARRPGRPRKIGGE